MLHAAWAICSSRPRALQPMRWQQHGTPCRSKRAKHAAVSSTGVWIARFRFVRRGLAFQAAKGFFSSNAGNGMAPLAAVSVQDALTCRLQVCGERGVASRDVGQFFKPPKGPSDQAPAAAWRPSPQWACKTHSKRSRYAAAPAQFVRGRGVASCDVGQLSSRPRALQTQRRQRHGNHAAVCEHDTPPRRPHVFG